MITEDEALAKAMELHPELAEWEDSDYEKAELEQGVNWHLHLTIDALAFRRASDPSLPDGAVLKELQRRGHSETEATHRIAALLIEDIWARRKLSDPKKDRSGKLSPALLSQLEAMNEDLNRKIRQLVTS